MSNFKFVCLQFLSVYVHFIYDFYLFLSNRYVLSIYFDFESCFQILVQFCSFVLDFRLFLYSLCKIFVYFDQIDKHFLPSLFPDFAFDFGRIGVGSAANRKSKSETYTGQNYNSIRTKIVISESCPDWSFLTSVIQFALLVFCDYLNI